MSFVTPGTIHWRSQLGNRAGGVHVTPSLSHYYIDIPPFFYAYIYISLTFFLSETNAFIDKKLGNKDTKKVDQKSTIKHSEIQQKGK